MNVRRFALPLAIGALVVGLFALPATAASPFAPTILAHTQARLAVCPSLNSALTGQFNVESLQVQRDGFAVYYTSQCLDDTDALTAGEGFRVYRRGLLDWQDIGGQDIGYYDAGCMLPSLSGQAVCCSVSTGDDGQYTAVFGRALARSTDVVEVTFGNGDAGRMRLVKDKFAIVTPAIVASARLRLYDHDGALLYERTLDLKPWARNTGSTGCAP